MGSRPRLSVSPLLTHESLGGPGLFGHAKGAFTGALFARPGGVDVGLIELDSTASKFDLALFATETEAGLTEQWTYRTDLFDRETIEELARAFGPVLQHIIGDASAPLRSITSA